MRDRLYIFHPQDSGAGHGGDPGSGARVLSCLVYEGVTLDIWALAKYDGQGECWKLASDDTAARYREQLISLATSINWDWEGTNKAKYIK